MTLYEMLLNAGLHPSEARRIHNHIKKLSGGHGLRSSPALVLQGKDFELTRLVRSRVEGEEEQVFTIKNIKL